MNQRLASTFLMTVAILLLPLVMPGCGDADPWEASFDVYLNTDTVVTIDGNRPMTREERVAALQHVAELAESRRLAHAIAGQSMRAEHAQALGLADWLSQIPSENETRVLDAIHAFVDPEMTKVAIRVVVPKREIDRGAFPMLANLVNEQFRMYLDATDRSASQARRQEADRIYAFLLQDFQQKRKALDRSGFNDDIYADLWRRELDMLYAARAESWAAQDATTAPAGGDGPDRVEPPHAAERDARGEDPGARVAGFLDARISELENMLLQQSARAEETRGLRAEIDALEGQINKIREYQLRLEIHETMLREHSTWAGGFSSSYQVTDISMDPAD